MAQLATSYEELKDYKNAADALKRAIELAPDEEELPRKLAEDLLSSRQWDEALSVFQELAAANPKDPSLQLRISEIYGAKRDPVEARAALDKAKAVDLQNVAVRYQDVTVLEAESKYDEAIAVLKSIIDDTKKTTYSAARPVTGKCSRTGSDRCTSPPDSFRKRWLPSAASSMASMTVKYTSSSRKHTRRPSSTTT